MQTQRSEVSYLVELWITPIIWKMLFSTFEIGRKPASPAVNTRSVKSSSFSRSVKILTLPPWTEFLWYYHKHCSEWAFAFNSLYLHISLRQHDKKVVYRSVGYCREQFFSVTPERRGILRISSASLIFVLKTLILVLPYAYEIFKIIVHCHCLQLRPPQANFYIDFGVHPSCSGYRPVKLCRGVAFMEELVYETPPLAEYVWKVLHVDYLPKGFIFWKICKKRVSPCALLRV